MDGSRSRRGCPGENLRMMLIRILQDREYSDILEWIYEADENGNSCFVIKDWKGFGNTVLPFYYNFTMKRPNFLRMVRRSEGRINEVENKGKNVFSIRGAPQNSLRPPGPLPLDASNRDRQQLPSTRHTQTSNQNNIAMLSGVSNSTHIANRAPPPPMPSTLPASSLMSRGEVVNENNFFARGRNRHFHDRRHLDMVAANPVNTVEIPGVGQMNRLRTNDAATAAAAQPPNYLLSSMRHMNEEVNPHLRNHNIAQAHIADPPANPQEVARGSRIGGTMDFVVSPQNNTSVAGNNIVFHHPAANILLYCRMQLESMLRRDVELSRALYYQKLRELRALIWEEIIRRSRRQHMNTMNSLTDRRSHFIAAPNLSQNMPSTLTTGHLSLPADFAAPNSHFQHMMPNSSAGLQSMSASFAAPGSIAMNNSNPSSTGHQSASVNVASPSSGSQNMMLNESSFESGVTHRNSSENNSLDPTTETGSNQARSNGSSSPTEYGRDVID